MSLFDLEGDLSDAILLGYEEGPGPWTRRAAARVLAVLREGPWFDEIVERMRYLWWTMNEDNSWPHTFEDGQAESVLDIEAAVRLLLLAAFGEE